MTMTTMPESLNSPVSGKTVFMEFGPPSQQMSPSSMSHGHYSMHCLHSAAHSQHDSSYSPASSFPRSLGYPYVNTVGSHSSSPYITTVQSYQSSTTLTQTRLEDTAPETEKNTVVEGERSDSMEKEKNSEAQDDILQFAATGSEQTISTNAVFGITRESRTRSIVGTHSNAGEDLVSEQEI